MRNEGKSKEEKGKRMNLVGDCDPHQIDTTVSQIQWGTQTPAPPGRQNGGTARGQILCPLAVPPQEKGKTHPFSSFPFPSDFVDECHLLWGDLSGYVWGQSDQEIAVPVVNERAKQTYYGVTTSRNNTSGPRSVICWDRAVKCVVSGPDVLLQNTVGAVDYLEREVILKAYDAGNSKNTIDYLPYLLTQSPHQRLLIFWDGATYHRSQEVQSFLALINQNLPKEQWKIHCVRFAPNCPEQNPIEDIWLQAKTWVRRFWALVRNFSHLKWLFEWFIRNTAFDFMSLQMSGTFSKIKY